MTLAEGAALACLAAGAVMFVAGTVGLIRFPDAFTRLHALTKADNLGLVLVILGLVLLGQSWTEIVKLAAIWFFVAMSSATTAHLIARYALQDQEGEKP